MRKISLENHWISPETSGNTDKTPIIRYKIGDSDHRPWGNWEVVDVGTWHIAKRVVIEPRQLLSFHVHKGRNEHWVIVKGTATYRIGDEEGVLSAGQCVYIPCGVPHSIGNDSEEPVIQVEVQTGDLLDETDIVRLEDRYGRV